MGVKSQSSCSILTLRALAFVNSAATRMMMIKMAMTTTNARIAPVIGFSISPCLINKVVPYADRGERYKLFRAITCTQGISCTDLPSYFSRDRRKRKRIIAYDQGVCHFPKKRIKSESVYLWQASFQGVSLFDVCTSRMRLNQVASIAAKISAKLLLDCHHQAFSVWR
jgi:hypothetical protein